MSQNIFRIAAPETRTKYLAGCCGLFSALVYAGTLSFEFVYDDRRQIIQNPAIRTWRFLPQYFTRGGLPWSSFYRPLDLLWFRANYLLFGLKAMGWHLTSVLAHAMATTMVFFLIRRLARCERTATLSALIFGLHPIHVQSVAWASGIPDPLLTIFVCASVIAYLNFRERKKIVWLSWSLLLYVCAVLTKEHGIVLPILIFAPQFLNSDEAGSTVPFAQKFKEARLALASFAGVAVAYLGARLHALAKLDPGTPSVSLMEMVLTWPGALWLFIKHLLTLCGYGLYYHLPPVRHLFTTDFFLPLALIALTAGVVGLLFVWLRVERNTWISAAIWIFIPLLPSLYLRGIHIETFCQDRYLYVPCIGFALLVSAVVVRIAELPPLSKQRLATVYATVAVAVGFANCTLIQEPYWANELALYRRAYRICPNNSDAIGNLAAALGSNNDFAAALPLFEEALRRDPNSAGLNYGYGYTLYRMGDYKGALRPLARALQIDPTLPDALLCMGAAHARLGYTQDAVFEIRRALAVDPERQGVHLAMSAALEMNGDLDGAIAETRIEAKNFPDDSRAQQRLIQLEQKAGKSL